MVRIARIGERLIVDADLFVSDQAGRHRQIVVGRLIEVQIQRRDVLAVRGVLDARQTDRVQLNVPVRFVRLLLLAVDLPVALVDQNQAHDAEVRKEIGEREKQVEPGDILSGLAGRFFEMTRQPVANVLVVVALERNRKRVRISVFAAGSSCRCFPGYSPNSMTYLCGDDRIVDRNADRKQKLQQQQYLERFDVGGPALLVADDQQRKRNQCQNAEADFDDHEHVQKYFLVARVDSV